MKIVDFDAHVAGAQHVVYKLNVVACLVICQNVFLIQCLLFALLSYIQRKHGYFV